MVNVNSNKKAVNTPCKCVIDENMKQAIRVAIDRLERSSQDLMVKIEKGRAVLSTKNAKTLENRHFYTRYKHLVEQSEKAWRENSIAVNNLVKLLQNFDNKA